MKINTQFLHSLQFYTIGAEARLAVITAIANLTSCSWAEAANAGKHRQKNKTSLFIIVSQYIILIKAGMMIKNRLRKTASKRLPEKMPDKIQTSSKIFI